MTTTTKFYQLPEWRQKKAEKQVVIIEVQQHTPHRSSFNHTIYIKENIGMVYVRLLYNATLMLTMIALSCDVCVYQVKIRSPRRQPFVWQFLYLYIPFIHITKRMEDRALSLI